MHVRFALARRALEMTLRVTQLGGKLPLYTGKTSFASSIIEFAYLIYYKKSNERRIMKICTHFNQVYLKLLKWKHYSKIFILIYFFMHKGQTLGNFFLFSNFFASHYVLEAKWIIFSYFSSQKYLLIIDIFGLLCYHMARDTVTVPT